MISGIWAITAALSSNLALRALLTAAALLLAAAPAFAADINVDSDCTLAQAITSANNNSAPSGSTCEDGEANVGDLIKLSAGVRLTAALPTISSNITVDGRGCVSGTRSTYCSIDGDNKYRIFDVEAASGEVSLGVRFITLTGGSAATGGGGAIRARGGSVTVLNSKIQNSKVKGTHASGGGIQIAGTAFSLTIQDSTFLSNSSQARHGGGVSIANDATVRLDGAVFGSNWAAGNGGGIYVGNNGADVEIKNSSIGGNFTIGDSPGDGGGLYLSGSSTVEIETSTFWNHFGGRHGSAIASGGTLTIENSTFHDNSAEAGAGAGVYVFGGTTTLTHITMNDNTSQSGGQALHRQAGTVNLYNSLLAGTERTCSGTLSGNAGNLIQDNTCSPSLSGDPGLGGRTGTPAYINLLSSSQAINAAAEEHCLSTDQIGNSRTASACDIGAIEFQGTPTTAQPTAEPTAAPTAVPATGPGPGPNPAPNPAGGSSASSGSGAGGESSSNWGAAEDAPVQTCEILMQETDITVTDLSGVGVGYQCQRADATAVGDVRVIAMGLVDAVDVWGWIALGIELCFPQSGAAVFLDAAHAPRTLHSLVSYRNDNGMTCVEIDRAGTVALVEGSPTYDYDPSNQLSNCMVFTKNILNFRKSPGGEIKGLIPALVTLTALGRAPDWYQVDYWGEVGWISADYVEPQGDCGA